MWKILFCFRGCFLTSSLIATLAISLTMPISMLADVLLKKLYYPCIFYLGTIPMILAFLTVPILSHFDNWDPALDLIKKLYIWICRKSRSIRWVSLYVLKLFPPPKLPPPSRVIAFSVKCVSPVKNVSPVKCVSPIKNVSPVKCLPRKMCLTVKYVSPFEGTQPPNMVKYVFPVNNGSPVKYIPLVKITILYDSPVNYVYP